MIRKILSDGRAGTDRAVLDVAIKLDIPHGGWIPKGHEKEEGHGVERSKFTETHASDSFSPIEMNILEADGTLLISRGKSLGDSKRVKQMAEKHNCPFLHVDLSTPNHFLTAQTISTWISRNEIEVLYITGSEDGEDMEFYNATAKILETVLYLDMVGFSMRAAEHFHKRFPETIDAATDLLISKLSLRDKTIIANMEEDNLFSIHPSLAEYIKTSFGLSAGNKELIASCMAVLGKKSIQADDAVSVIIEETWKRLRKTHRLRVIK